MADNRLIPDGIRDERSLAYNDLLDRIGEMDITPLLIYVIDNVAASALPHLAQQRHIMGPEGWSMAKTDAEKRALIKAAPKLHKKKGTKSAVLNALAALNLETTLEEWFEYAGDPFYFRIKMSSENREFPETIFEDVTAIINAWKRKSAWLDTLTITSAVRGQTPSIAAAVIASETVIIYPSTLTFNRSIECAAPVISAALMTGETIEVYPPLT